MSIYTKRAFESTKGRGGKDLADDLRATEQQARQTYRQFGGTGPAPGLSSRDRADAQREFDIADERRREGAAANLAGLTGQIDARRAGISDAISDSLDAQTQAEISAQAQLGRAQTETDFAKRQTMGETEDALRDISFKEYQSQTQRDDKLDELYQKGAVEKVMHDAAVEGKLRQQDIDFYYKKLMQDLTNAFELWKTRNTAEAESKLREIDARASNIAGIIQGGIQTVNALYQSFNREGYK